MVSPTETTEVSVEKEESAQQKASRLQAELASVQAQIAASPAVVEPHLVDGIKDGCKTCFTQLGDFLDKVGRQLGVTVPTHTDAHESE